jgi:hypothetical protein
MCAHAEQRANTGAYSTGAGLWPLRRQKVGAKSLLGLVRKEVKKTWLVSIAHRLKFAPLGSMHSYLKLRVHTMATVDFKKYLQADTSENEDLWVWFAFVVFFPVVIFWYSGRMLTKGIEAAHDQMAVNARRQMIRDNQQVEQSAQRRLKMQKEHQIYLAEREKRLQAYEEKLRTTPAT